MSSVLLGGLGAVSLIVLPAAAAVVDILYQKVRFPSLRWPESALATGLFLALLLPPTVNLAEAIGVTVAAVGVRHALRLQGRPWVNPAASGVLLGAVLFGIGPAWWAAVTPQAEILVGILGVLLAARQPSRWRLPVLFFAVYGFFSALEHFMVGGILSPRLLLLSAVDPSVLFFGLFMVTEPRTAPSDPQFQPTYAVIVAIGAAFLPVFLPSVGILLALIAGNGIAFVHRRATVSQATDPQLPVADSGLSPRSGRTPRRLRREQERRARAARARARWPLGQRAGSLVLVTVMLGAIALAMAGPGNPPPTTIIATPPGGGSVGGGPSGGGGSSGGGYSNCQVDNPSIPASTLQQLHRALGPSVILSYNANTGVVVFYDPANQVTVTETDMYEDYGFAEFNGDDYAVAGCS